MPSALSHDPAITVPGASTDNAIVIFDGTGGTGFGNSTIVVDSGGNGRIGIATDTNLITLTNETVAVAGAITGVTALTVDNININGNTISSTAGTDLLITPLGGQQIILDGTIIIDAGVVTGATSITSTEFVGGGVGLTALNGTQVTSGTLPAARIAADSIVEAKFDVSNGPTNGQFLQAQSGEGGGLTWATAGATDISVKAVHGADQDSTSGTEAPVIFTATDEWDTDNMHSTGSNTGRITFNTAGKYFIQGHVQIAGNTSGRRHLAIRLNGGNRNVVSQSSPSLADQWAHQVSVTLNVSVNDYVELMFLQTSGSTLAIQNNNGSPWFAAHKIN